MANLGSQAGSGLDASDITTGTLGNTVQDNITRLGTVTTGTIGSSVTFPSGHVVQVVSEPNTYNYTIGSASANHSTNYTLKKNSTTDWEPSLTNVKQGNKILVVGHVCLSKGTDDAFIAYHLDAKVDSGSYANVALGDSAGSRARKFGMARPYSHYVVVVSPITYEYSPTISGSTGTVTFRVTVSQGAGSNRDIIVNRSGGDNTETITAVSNMTLMEIQQ